MSYASLENSRSKGMPVHLYLFRYGDNPDDIYAYTDCDQPITWPLSGPDAQIYTPIPIDRDAIKSSGSLDGAEMKFRTDNSNGVARLFDGWPPSYVIRLRIFRGHFGDNDFHSIWNGRVTGAGGDDNETSFSIEPISTSLRRLGVRRNWQNRCPHPLYSQGDYMCNANKAAASETAVVTGVTSPLVTLAAGWNGSRDRDSFTNGLMEWTGTDGLNHVRNIMLVTGELLRISGAATGMVVGTSVTVSLGCSQDMPDCETLHNNIKNYGGDPWIPLDNPMGFKNIFSGG